MIDHFYLLLGFIADKARVAIAIHHDKLQSGEAIGDIMVRIENRPDDVNLAGKFQVERPEFGAGIMAIPAVFSIDQFTIGEVRRIVPREL